MFYVYVLKVGERVVGTSDHMTILMSDSKDITWVIRRRHGMVFRGSYYTENFRTRAEAVKRERYFKTGRGRDEVDRLC
jgi:hypothetical protein